MWFGAASDEKELPTSRSRMNSSNYQEIQGHHLSCTSTIELHLFSCRMMRPSTSVVLPWPLWNSLPVLSIFHIECLRHLGKQFLQPGNTFSNTIELKEDQCFEPSGQRNAEKIGQPNASLRFRNYPKARRTAQILNICC